DDVDLAAAACTEIAVKNLITVTAQKTGGDFLTASAALKMWRRGLRAREEAAPPVRMSGDGSNKAQIHAVSSDAVRCCNLCAGQSNIPEIARRSHASFDHASPSRSRWPRQWSNYSNRRPPPRFAE